MSEPASSPALDRGLDASKVGHRLRAERERLGIGLRELARRVGVSPSLVSQIELDRVNPSVSTLYSIVTELGMTMSDVFGEQPGERVVQRDDGLAETPGDATRDQSRVGRALGASHARPRPRRRVPVRRLPGRSRVMP